MKSKFILFFYIVAMIGLWSYKKYTHVYLAQCSDSQFHAEILYQLRQITPQHMTSLPSQQLELAMGQYDALQIYLSNIQTQKHATRESPVAHCIATLKIAPQVYLKQKIALPPIFQQHKTIWQPETQTATLRFTANNNHDTLTEAVQMDLSQKLDLTKLPAHILLEWNALTQKQLNPTAPALQPKPEPKAKAKKPEPKPEPKPKSEEELFVEGLYHQDVFRKENSVVAHIRRLITLETQKDDLISSLSPNQLKQWQEYEAQLDLSCTNIQCHIQHEKSQIVWLEQLFNPAEDKKTILANIEILMTLQSKKMDWLLMMPTLSYYPHWKNYHDKKCRRIHCQINYLTKMLMENNKYISHPIPDIDIKASTALQKHHQIHALSRDISDLIMTLSSKEREAWFQHRDDKRMQTLWHCQFRQYCHVEHLREQKRILQAIHKAY